MNESFIKTIKKIVSISSSEEDFIRSNVKYKTFKKGDFLVKQNEVCKNISFIVSGCVKTTYLDQKGNEHVMFFAVENWWAGDSGSFYSQTPADYTVECLEETTVIQNSLTDLEDLYLRVPIMERFFRIIVQNAYVNLQKKMVQYLSLSAKERYLIFNKKYAAIEQRVPQYLIASYLGVTKEFFSKMKKEIAQKKFN